MQVLDNPEKGPQPVYALIVELVLAGLSTVHDDSPLAKLPLLRSGEVPGVVRSVTATFHTMRPAGSSRIASATTVLMELAVKSTLSNVGIAPGSTSDGLLPTTTLTGNAAVPVSLPPKSKIAPGGGGPLRGPASVAVLAIAPTATVTAKRIRFLQFIFSLPSFVPKFFKAKVA